MRISDWSSDVCSSDLVGSAGSDEKCRWLLDEAGVDAAVNYKTCGDLEAAVAEHCPDGIDVYFENVGGDHLEIGRASCRERVCQYVSISVVAVPLTKNRKINDTTKRNHTAKRNN